MTAEQVGVGKPAFRPIAHHVRIVLQVFSLLRNSPPFGQQAWLNSEELLSPVKNEEIRFKTWAGNLGAHHVGKSSLDYRLRQASHLQDQVIYLLKTSWSHYRMSVGSLRLRCQ